MSLPPKRSISPASLYTATWENIATARRLRAESALLRCATKAAIRQSRATIAQCRANPLRERRDWEPVVLISIPTLLLSFPKQEGSWIVVAPSCARLINEMLDAGSTLIKERFVEEDGERRWEVRLTPRGLSERELYKADDTNLVATA
jgi:hypothetical protein